MSDFVEFPPGAYLSVTLESSGGNYQHTLSLMKMGSGYVSDPWALPRGEYMITDFMVMNEEDEVLYATPKEGSTLAAFVSDPLPVSFMVNADDVINVSMEVVSASDYTPEDFGYVSFGIQLAPVPQFSVSVFIPGDGGFVLTDAAAYFLRDADTLVSTFITPGVNPITFVGKSDTTYTMVIVKQGYARYTKEFTLQDLTDEYGDSPVKVMLEPAFTMSTPVAGGDFTLDLEGEAGMTLHGSTGVMAPAIPLCLQTSIYTMSMSIQYLVLSLSVLQVILHPFERSAFFITTAPSRIFILII